MIFKDDPRPLECPDPVITPARPWFMRAWFSILRNDSDRLVNLPFQALRFNTAVVVVQQHILVYQPQPVAVERVMPVMLQMAIMGLQIWVVAVVVVAQIVELAEQVARALLY
jgi:hypothetical protein